MASLLFPKERQISECPDTFKYSITLDSSGSLSWEPPMHSFALLKALNYHYWDKHTLQQKVQSAIKDFFDNGSCGSVVGPNRVDGVIISRSRSTLHSLPPEVRSMIFRQCIEWDGLMPDLIVALRADPCLYSEALETFYSRNYFLRWYSWKYPCSPAMSAKARETVRKLDVISWDTDFPTEEDALKQLESSRIADRFICGFSNVRILAIHVPPYPVTEYEDDMKVYFKLFVLGFIAPLPALKRFTLTFCDKIWDFEQYFYVIELFNKCLGAGAADIEEQNPLQPQVRSWDNCKNTLSKEEWAKVLDVVPCYTCVHMPEPSHLLYGKNLALSIRGKCYLLEVLCYLFDTFSTPEWKYQWVHMLAGSGLSLENMEAEVPLWTKVGNGWMGCLC